MTLHSEAVKEIDLDALRGITAAFDLAIERCDLWPLERTQIREAARYWKAALAELTTRRARDAEVAALVEADLEYDRAFDAAAGFTADGYEEDSYGVYGSEFYRCLACGAESGAGVLNKGVTHESDCVRRRYEVAIERRAAAILPFQRSDDKGDAT